MVCMYMTIYMCDDVDVCRHESLAGPFKFSSGSEQVFNESGCCIDPASLLGSPHGNYDPQAGSHTVPIALVVTTSDNSEILVSLKMLGVICMFVCQTTPTWSRPRCPCVLWTG